MYMWYQDHSEKKDLQGQLPCKECPPCLSAVCPKTQCPPCIPTVCPKTECPPCVQDSTTDKVLEYAGEIIPSLHLDNVNGIEAQFITISHPVKKLMAYVSPDGTPTTVTTSMEVDMAPMDNPSQEVIAIVDLRDGTSKEFRNATIDLLSVQSVLRVRMPKTMNPPNHGQGELTLQKTVNGFYVRGGRRKFQVFPGMNVVDFRYRSSAQPCVWRASDAYTNVEPRGWLPSYYNVAVILHRKTTLLSSSMFGLVCHITGQSPVEPTSVTISATQVIVARDGGDAGRDWDFMDHTVLVSWIPQRNLPNALILSFIARVPQESRTQVLSLGHDPNGGLFLSVDGVRSVLSGVPAISLDREALFGVVLASKGQRIRILHPNGPVYEIPHTLTGHLWANSVPNFMALCPNVDTLNLALDNDQNGLESVPHRRGLLLVYGNPPRDTPSNKFRFTRPPSVQTSFGPFGPWRSDRGCPCPHGLVRVYAFT